MNPFVLDIILEVVKAVVGVIIPAITIYLAFYTKRFNERMERKALLDEVNRLTNFASQSRTFLEMDMQSKIDAIVESVVGYAMRNEIGVDETVIRMLVESSFSSLKLLESNGLRLYKTKHNIGEEK